MPKPHELVALIDMDGTVADFDGAMRRDLATLTSPGEQVIAAGPDDSDEPLWLKARKKLTKTQPGWWRNLPVYGIGMAAYTHLRVGDVLAAPLDLLGPRLRAAVRPLGQDHHREARVAQVTITEDKGLVYGKVLVDDWPAYGIRWLEWRPRGLLVVPAWPWNTLDQYPEHLHPNIIRLTGDWPTELPLLLERIAAIKESAR